MGPEANPVAMVNFTSSVPEKCNHVSSGKVCLSQQPSETYPCGDLKAGKMAREMNDKQRRFVHEYLIDLNATQAAIRAGYSPKTAHVQGPRLLDNAEVQAFLDQAKDRRSKETQIDAAWVLKRLAAEAEADVSDLYDATGAILPVSEWPLIWRQGLVAGIEHIEVKDHEGNKTGDVVVKLKLSDRIRRLELIGKHVRVNAFQEVVQHKGLEGLADRLARAKKRDV